MRCFMRSSIYAMLVVLLVSFPVQAQALMKKWTSRIEADPAKHYQLDKAHGPWMVMVASFRSLVGDENKSEGISPEETARELVLELRKQGIPAYVYEVKAEQEIVKVKDDFGRDVRKKNLRRVDSVCVLAGNYESIDPETDHGRSAQKTLMIIKKMHPVCLTKGVIYAKSPGRPGPLSGAFLAPNPLLSMDELESSKKSLDPLLIRLNGDEQFSLYENQGKYTLVVARFMGKQINVVNSSLADAEAKFTNKPGELNSLDQAAIQARTLVRALRSREPLPLNAHPDAPQLQQFCRMEAFVWHDYSSSVVTVGSFDTPNDPEAKRLAAMFASKTVVGPGGRQTTNCRFLPVLHQDKSFTFIPFSPTPELMLVPTKR